MSPLLPEKGRRRWHGQEEQNIRALNEVDAGMAAAKVCRKMGITEPTFCRWKSKFGGMDVSDAKRLKQLEDENNRPRKLLAYQMLDNHALKLVLSKYGEAGGVPPSRRLRTGGDEALGATKLSRAGLDALEPHLRFDEAAAGGRRPWRSRVRGSATGGCTHCWAGRASR